MDQNPTGVAKAPPTFSPPSSLFQLSGTANPCRDGVS